MNTLFEHRSIRKYKPDPIPEEILQRVLQAAVRASNTGNMQVYSIVVTREEEMKEKLAPCHFNQPMVREAPVLLTFCADVHRFSRWCELRGARPEYENFLWFVNGAIDATLASQNAALEAEHHGLGICYLGTTTYTADKISEILELPRGVIPVTTLVVGYPDETPPVTDRLPLEAVVHQEKYRIDSGEQTGQWWAEKENSEEARRLMEINGLPNLARIFTERRYKGEDNLRFSEAYLEVLKKQGFLK